MRSHEEQQKLGEMYRPSSFPFPRTRGRVGFELYEDGAGIEIGIRAEDGTSTTRLHWEVVEDDLLKLDVDGNQSIRNFRIRNLSRDGLIIEEIDELPPSQTETKGSDERE